MAFQAKFAQNAYVSNRHCDPAVAGVAICWTQARRKALGTEAANPQSEPLGNVFAEPVRMRLRAIPLRCMARNDGHFLCRFRQFLPKTTQSDVCKTKTAASKTTFP
jgi:hypothetical protein